MARLPALVDALAETDFRNRKTLAHIARQARDGHLISSTTRGAGAAAMTYKDAAAYLMAACGDINPIGAVTAAERLRDLRPAPADQMWLMQREDLPPHFDWLREPTDFGRTLELLIEHAPQLAEWEAAYSGGGNSEADFSMERAAERLASSPAGFRPGLSKPVRVIFYVPGSAAEVHLGWVWNDLVQTDAFHEYYVAAAEGFSQEESSRSVPDVMIPIEVGVRTLLALHNAVNAKPPTRGPAKRH